MESGDPIEVSYSIKYTMCTQDHQSFQILEKLKQSQITPICDRSLKCRADFTLLLMQKLSERCIIALLKNSIL